MGFLPSLPQCEFPWRPSPVQPGPGPVFRPQHCPTPFKAWVPNLVLSRRPQITPTTPGVLSVRTTYSPLPTHTTRPGVEPRSGWPRVMSPLTALHVHSYTGSAVRTTPTGQTGQCVLWVCSAAQSFQTLCDLMDHSPSGPSVHGISPARMLE